MWLIYSQKILQKSVSLKKYYAENINYYSYHENETESIQLTAYKLN